MKTEEEKKEWQREYYLKNKELIREKQKEYYAKKTADKPKKVAMTKEERNEPANVALAVEKLAEIQNTDVSIIDETTEANAHHVFGI